MQFQPFKDYDSVNQFAAKITIDFIKKKPNSLVCIATGNSPNRSYKLLAKHQKYHPDFFKQVSIIQLDEWMGLSQNNPASCAYFIQNRILNPLKIHPNNTFLFDGKTQNLNAEIKRANQFLDKKEGIDLCILGIGKNGHLGFNEPSNDFSKRTHFIPLESETQNHTMVQNLSEKPTHGITLGIEDILKSKQIILILTGDGKKEIFEFLKTKTTTPDVPVSALWNHPNTHFLIDQSSIQ